MRHHPSLAAGSTHRLFLPSLDGARGLAVCLVLLDHLGSAKIIPFRGFRGMGHIGVFLFFSLSAFLLTVPFWLESDAALTEWETWSTYLWRRFLRIYPLYTLVLLTEHFTQTDFPWSSVADHLLLRQGVGVFWTMEIETKYYLILPLMVLTFMVAWRRNATMGMLCAIATAVIVHSLLRIEGKWWSQDGHVLSPYLLVFLTGSLAGSAYAFAILNYTPSRSLRRVCEAAAIGSLALSFFTLPAFSGRLPKALNPGWHAGIILTGIFWAVFILGHLNGVGYVKSFLELRPLRYLGLISYSVYLWHEPVIDWFWRLKRSGWMMGYPWPVHVLLLVGAVLVAASLSFFFVERPFSKLKARFTRSL